MGVRRLLSSSLLTSSAPGRELYAPTSAIAAPSRTSSSTRVLRASSPDTRLSG